jgi:alginate O-acetyltransferase complex protein AlgI
VNFGSVTFAVFLVAVYALYWWRGRLQGRVVLLVASYLFYAAWDWRFAGLLLLCTVVDFSVGRGIITAASENQRRRLLGISLAVNLGLLAFFKYFDFFAESLVALLELGGLSLSTTTTRITLPIGISFYTFRSLTYTIDLYRGQAKTARSLLDYAVFVSFFPLLGAGPIVRARQFLPQLSKTSGFTPSDIEAGASRFLLGLFQKAIVADTLGAHLVDPAFADPAACTTGTLWLALFGYSVQIYADFSGYSSMAIGISRLFGIRVPENFQLPYLARNISDFWRRWHISLTSWFRDYLWWSIAKGIPYTARVRFSCALVFVFVVSGLWHGAGWTFVAWGALHGLALVANQQWRLLRGEPAPGRLHGVTSLLATQALVVLAWLPFRAPDFSVATIFLQGLFLGSGGEPIRVPPAVGLAFAAAIVEHIIGYLSERRRDLLDALPVSVRGVAYAVLLVILWHGMPGHANQFIYFRF